jgi:hypothetical protein
MDDEVDGAQDECGINEGRNALYAKASAQNVKIIPEKLKNEKNGGVHDNDAKTERKDDDRSEDQCKNRLQDGIQECEDERDKGKLKKIGGYDKTRNVEIGKPKPESVSCDDDDDSEKPTHTDSIPFLTIIRTLGKV